MRWIVRIQQRLSEGDAFAEMAGWTHHQDRGGGRVYRDPRFGQRQAEASKTAQPAGIPLRQADHGRRQAAQPGRSRGGKQADPWLTTTH